MFCVVRSVVWFCLSSWHGSSRVWSRRLCLRWAQPLGHEPKYFFLPLKHGTVNRTKILMTAFDLFPYWWNGSSLSSSASLCTFLEWLYTQVDGTPIFFSFFFRTTRLRCLTFFSKERCCDKFLADWLSWFKAFCIFFSLVQLLQKPPEISKLITVNLRYSKEGFIFGHLGRTVHSTCMRLVHCCIILLHSNLPVKVELVWIRPLVCLIFEK